MYLLMQPETKPGYYNPLPLGITLSSMFQYIGIHIQFSHQNFKIFVDLSHIQLFTLNVKDQAPQLTRTSPAGSQLSTYPKA